jgi:hypothetical protein
MSEEKVAPSEAPAAGTTHGPSVGGSGDAPAASTHDAAVPRDAPAGSKGRADADTGPTYQSPSYGPMNIREGWTDNEDSHDASGH